MSSDRWNQINELFHEALALDPQQRPAFLKNACGTDELLQSEIQSLLAANDLAGNFIETPVAANVFDSLTDDVEPLAAGQKVGAYRIVREIGRGGMGAVYLAERDDQHYQKYVALKLVKRGMDTDYVLRHFRNERQILANFDHPNIARLFDGGSTETGLPYFVMEYVEGLPIDQYCDSHNLSISKRLELFCRVCEAVSYAHRHMVIHRDIKPSNILVTRDGIPKLMDFGIAKILQADAGDEPTATATNLRVMTPEYASPEQALGLPVTTATDVYSLGVVLYELLTGHSPYRFKSRSPIDVARMITDAEPKMPSTVINTQVEDQPAKPLTPETVSKSREGTPERLRRRLMGDIDNIVLMALRKEPEKRYQSVEQFSEDITRHLTGLPVIARKVTVAYRGGKFIRRNKVAVAAAGFAIAALIVSAILAGVIQWRANQRARFLQEFGAEAARIEGIMRFAYLLPLHDVSTERRLVEQRMEAIRARMAALGAAASGPGNYALGRGYMALQNYREAKGHFESAVKISGYKTAELSYSYGLTLAMLYQTELESAARISNPEQRVLRIKEIQKEFRSPALAFIQEGRQAAEYSEYAEALVGFLDERLDQAISRSEQVMQKTPWLYESAKLQGDSYRQMGKQFLSKGKYADAVRAFNEAEAAYEKSIEKGSSDPSGYVGLCNLTANILEMQVARGEPVDTTYQAGQDQCQKALKADSRNVEAYLALTSLHNEWAQHSYQYAGSEPALQKSIQAARAATQLEPDTPRTYRALGEAESWLADYQYRTLADPRATVRSAVQSLEKAIHFNPNDGDSYSFLGSVFQVLAQYQNDRGDDPRKALDQSQESLKEAARLSPGSYEPMLMIGGILTTKAEYETENGLDAGPSLESALVALQRASKINPNYYLVYDYIGYADLTKAEYQVAIGQDPMASLDHALQAFQKSLQNRQTNFFAIRSQAQAEWRIGEHLITMNKDASAHLEKARHYLEIVRATDKSDWTGYLIRGEIELAEARLKMSQRKSPINDFRNSLYWFQYAEDRSESEKFFDTWYSRTRIYRWWAEWDLQSNLPCDREVSLGLQTAARAEKLNPRSAEIMGLRGVLLLFQARSLRNLEQKKEYAGKARASLEAALKTNPNVAYTFTPFLREAEQLVN